MKLANSGVCCFLLCRKFEAVVIEEGRRVMKISYDVVIEKNGLVIGRWKLVRGMNALATDLI